MKFLVGKEFGGLRDEKCFEFSQANVILVVPGSGRENSFVSWVKIRNTFFNFDLRHSSTKDVGSCNH